MKTFFIIAVVVVAFGLTGCQTKTGQYGAAGAGTGALAGGIIGHQSGETGEGAAIGAAVGGLTGAAIGHHQDEQDRQRRDQYYRDDQHYRDQPRRQY